MTGLGEMSLQSVQWPKEPQAVLAPKLARRRIVPSVRMLQQLSRCLPRSTSSSGNSNRTTPALQAGSR